jgi:hypothetical protein
MSRNKLISKHENDVAIVSHMKDVMECLYVVLNARIDDLSTEEQ